MSDARRDTALRRPTRMVRSSLMATVIAVSALVGCGGSPSPDGRPESAIVEGHTAGSDGSPATPASGEAASPARLTGSDLAWLQLMIPMNDRILLLLDLTSTGTDDEALASLADRLATNHRAELEDLHALREEAGVPDTNPHEGHRMTGMVTDDQLAEAAAEPPSRFDATVIDLLREHLEHSRTVSEGLLDAGSDEDALALAATLVDRREEQLAELTELFSPTDASDITESPASDAPEG
ncbi:DUF305 domain-containing protein [Streptomyces alkaliphilus]|uniref:DUF305 domain-containing protein n=1 Tax=Streptomyces alkaliphilus TaxID=1472722 RepID=A0A7W3TDB0_9ACTN|nr:DUF305 domain-containing protein [Streptomyces alkaliphilus]MBB0244658.1 DUF305 domain-containing protein [Streptomyces alkaliphilus]